MELFRIVLIELAGRLEAPKPCGARPESVVLPCALQERPELPGRAALFVAEPVVLCGRLVES